MPNPIALLCLILRTLRPTRGLHTSPLGYLRELSAELSARRRSRRVRRYAEHLPTVAEDDTATEPAPLVPAPRRPLDNLRRTALSAAVPVVDPREVQAPAALVRGYYVAHERRQAEKEADRQRLGIAVLMDIARDAKNAEVSA